MTGAISTINRKRLVFFERFFDPVAEDILGNQDDIELVKLRYGDDEEDNWQELSRTCGYQISARTELVEPWFGNAALIARAPRLLAICALGAGYDVIDVDACTAAGIVVCSQSGTNFEPVAEHAIGLILNLSKKIGLTNRMMLKGAADDRWAMIGNNIVGKTVGIVGIGAIGSRTAQLCRAFDMTVLAYDPYLTADEIAARGARKVEFDELLQHSDFITVHCPRTAETLGMFDAAAFARMKPTAYFVNTARGGIHDEEALLDVLRRGAIAGAGIDVFAREPPPPDHPLLLLDNVIATPHVAGITSETFHSMSIRTAEQWIDLMRGKVPPRLVNPEVWPRYSERFEQIIGFRPQPLS
jgi:D-3-phosphoglycerate dehydrogenase